MKEVLAQHNNLMNYVEGIYKNQKLMLYWLNDQESRLNQTESLLNVASQVNATAPVDNNSTSAAVASSNQN